MQAPISGKGKLCPKSSFYCTICSTKKTGENHQNIVNNGVFKRGEAPLPNFLPLPLKGKGDKGGWGSLVKTGE